jgi:hypothetical protein
MKAAPLGKRILRTAGLALGLVALLGLVIVVFFEDALIYHPTKGGVGPSPGGDVDLVGADGVRVHAWWLPDPKAPFALLHLHGNAGNLEDRRDLLVDLKGLGLNVLAVDYRGYGKSDGKPSEAGLYADARAAFDWLAKKVPPERIVIHGESLGGAVAIELASKVPCAGLVVQSTFTSAPDMSSRVLPWFPARWFMRSRFDNLAKVPGLKIPKLFIHSRTDEIIPFEMAERLYAAAAEPKRSEWFTGPGHNDLVIARRKAFLESIRTFVASLAK